MSFRLRTMSQVGRDIELNTKDLRLQGQFRLLIVGSPGKLEVVEDICGKIVTGTASIFYRGRKI